MVGVRPPGRKEWGLGAFVPPAVLRVMKAKSVRKALARLAKDHEHLAPPGRKVGRSAWAGRGSRGRGAGAMLGDRALPVC